MFGDNPIRKPLKGDGNQLEIQSIFKTLQGEGIYAGWPAIFIRLGGCNLACDFCDTEFESFKPMMLDTIMARVSALSGKADDDTQWTHRLVVITGGEPFRQPIERLCNIVLDAGYKVQIETNGTLYRPLDERVDIICSPKVSGGSYHPIREDLLARINAFKFIISASHPDYQHVPDVGQDVNKTPVYVQPMDEKDEEKNRQNRALAVRLAQGEGYRLSLQIHKILGLE